LFIDDPLRKSIRTRAGISDRSFFPMGGVFCFMRRTRPSVAEARSTVPSGLARPLFAVAPDGRFLLNETVDEATTTTLTVVLNWDAELR